MMDEIHFRCVPYSVIQELAVKLEPPHSNNWIQLAERIANYTTEKVLYLQARKGDKSDCTQLLFEEYVKKENATVQKVQTALEQMDRLDALEVLNKHMPEIEKRHQEEKNLPPPSYRQPEEVSYGWRSLYCQPESMCSSCCPSGGHMTRLPMSRCHVGTCHPYNSPPIRHQNGTPSHPLDMRTSFPVQNGHIYHQQGHYYSGHYPRRVPEVRSDSLEVQNDIQGQQDASLDIEMVDTHQHEDGVPLDQGIMRGENQLTSYNIAAESMGRLGGIDVGREEVVRPSGDEIGVIYLRNKTGEVGRPSFFSQTSEERNSLQPESQKIGAYFTKKIVNNSDPVSSPDSRCGASPPISKLKRLADLPPQYQPHQDYRHFVADQKVEDGHEAKSRPVKEEKLDLPVTGGYNPDNFMDIKLVQPKVKNGMRDNIPKTFPRVKADTAPNLAVHDIKGNQSNSLTKSTSMPVDMKPAEFRKAWRYIKVFVTYSNDNKKHLQRVLSLCNCLVKNGFSCCVDINSRYVSTLPNQYDRVNWYKEKFSESDFILVCPSPKYKMETEAHDMLQNAPVSENQLHTRLIYKLMQQEYNAKSRNTRFVPVLFEGMSEDLLPVWLQSSLKYNWPGQFKDLLWMLTRPEDRIKPSAKLFSESAKQSDSPGHDPGF